MLLVAIPRIAKTLCQMKLAYRGNTESIQATYRELFSDDKLITHSVRGRKKFTLLVYSVVADVLFSKRGLLAQSYQNKQYGWNCSLFTAGDRYRDAWAETYYGISCLEPIFILSP